MIVLTSIFTKFYLLYPLLLLFFAFLSVIVVPTFIFFQYIVSKPVPLYYLDSLHGYLFFDVLLPIVILIVFGFLLLIVWQNLTGLEQQTG